MNYKIIIPGVLLIFLVITATAQQLDLERQQRLKYGDVMRIDSINTTPSEIRPGEPAEINIKIRNSGDTEIKDIRIQVVPPVGTAFLEDTSKKLEKLSSFL